MIREAEIKKALSEYIKEKNSYTDTCIVEELRLNGGEIRADIVDLNEMHCYEIKSEGDSLNRLIRQGTQYGKTFDKVTIVTARCHLERVLEIVPSWWGIIVVGEMGKNFLKNYRQAKINKRLLSPEDLATLFSKEEALNVLEIFDTSKGWKSKSLYKIQSHIASLLSLDDLKNSVKESLLKRLNAECVA
ncbi:sce7726 family protein [Lonsdalea quercina]|uniref:sce7726 family protein n=1 Tax=Lonsdalea quercina TaxID=71657 RepID=UPI003976E752